MPARLRPTAPIAADAILVGDPGRALLLAQHLLEEPKMSNHARGLWGYTGATHEGRLLTIQSTGMGGPSAALVLADLAELGLRRAIRVGTCIGLTAAARPGDLLLVGQARHWVGTQRRGPAARPDKDLTAAVERELGGGGRTIEVASLDTLHRPGAAALPGAAEAADMQTASLLRAAGEERIALAALLVVAEGVDAPPLEDEPLGAAAMHAGSIAAAAF